VKVITEDDNNTALAEDTSDDDFMIDSAAPETNVALSGTQEENDWWTSDVTVTLSATDNLSGVKETKYRINDGFWETYSEPFTISGSTIYYQSEDNAGNLEDEKSQEIKIDKTASSTPVVTDDGDSTSSTIELHASWTATDTESGIAEYQYSIGATPGGTDVVTWTPIGTDVEITATGLSLTNRKTYYFSVKSKNSAGLWADVGSSNGIVVVSEPIVINVPADYATIQAAIDAAFDGDTVLVTDGTYKGTGNVNLDFKGKAITVKSVNGAENCIIDCENIDDTRGFYFYSGETSAAVVDGFTLRNGNAEHGGGIYCEDSSPTITNNTITGNSVKYAGGGICCYHSSPTITNNTITTNSARRGGGVYCNGSSSTIINNIIVANSASTYGGGIRCSYNSSPIISNNTITANTAGTHGGGVSCYKSSLTISSSILWNNSPQEVYFDADGEPNIITISYSDIQGGQAGIVTNDNGTVNWLEGNIDSDPMFVDVANDDYHLSDYSPCIGVGTTTGAPDTDIEGNPRGTPPDIGAYENARDIPIVTPNVTNSTGESNVTATSARLNGEVTDTGDENPTVHIYWGDNDGGTDAGSWDNDVNLGTKSAGTFYTDISGLSPNTTYYYRCYTENSAGDYWASSTESFTTLLLNVCYVKPSIDGGNDNNSGATWEDAKATVHEAIVVTSNTGTILVKYGTYNITSSIDFGGKNLKLASDDSTHSSYETAAADAEQCIINAGENCRIFHFHSGETSDAIVDGFTIQNGRDENGSGIYCHGSSPTIQNNIISGNRNSASNNNGGGIYCYGSSNPTIQNNTISGNSAESGGGISCKYSNPEIQGNVITGNSAFSGGGIFCHTASPTIQNNIISGNSGSSCGGISCYSSHPTIQNNTITGNKVVGICCFSSNPTITNTILWGNGIRLENNSDPKVTYSCVQGGYTGTGNIDEYPMFVSTTEGSEDYHLRDTSPCIGAQCRQRNVQKRDAEKRSIQFDIGNYWWWNLIEPKFISSKTVNVFSSVRSQTFQNLFGYRVPFCNQIL